MATLGAIMLGIGIALAIILGWSWLSLVKLDNLFLYCTGWIGFFIVFGSALIILSVFI